MTESEELGRIARARRVRRRIRRGVVIVAANPYLQLSVAELQAILANPGATADARAKATAALQAKGQAPASSAHAFLTRHMAPGTQYSTLPTGPGARWSTVPGGPRGALIPHSRFSPTATMGADLRMVAGAVFPGIRRAAAERGMAAQAHVDLLRGELLAAAPGIGIHAVRLAGAPGLYEGWGGPAGAGVLVVSTPGGDPMQEADTLAASILFYSRAPASRARARAIIAARVMPNGDRGTWVEFVAPGPGPGELRSWWKAHAGSLMREGFSPGEARIVTKTPRGKVQSVKVVLEPPEGTQRLTRPGGPQGMTVVPPAPATPAAPAPAPAVTVTVVPATPAPAAVAITRAVPTAAEIKVGVPAGMTSSALPTAQQVQTNPAEWQATIGAARRGQGRARLQKAEQQLAQKGRVDSVLWAQIAQDRAHVCQRLQSAQLPAKKRRRLTRAIQRLDAVLSRGSGKVRMRGEDDDDDELGEHEESVDEFGVGLSLIAAFITGKRKRIRKAEKQLSRGKVKPRLLQRLEQDARQIQQKLQRVRRRRRRQKLMDLLERIEAVQRGDRSMEGVFAGIAEARAADDAELERAEEAVEQVNNEIAELEGAHRAARRAGRATMGAVDFGAHKKAKLRVARARQRLGDAIDRLRSRRDTLKSRIQTLEDKEIRGLFRRMKERSRDKRVERLTAKLEPIEERIEAAEEEAREKAEEAKEKAQAAAQAKALEEFERTLEGARRSFASPGLQGRRQFWGIV